MSSATLYETSVRHVRTTPMTHAFDNRSYWWSVDLDDLPVLPRLLRALARFEARDHLGSPDRSIRANVDALCAEHGIDLTGGSVRMLANARVLGYVFNPLSVYWCHRADGSLACVLAEVHNTYKGRHTYVVETDERGRARVDKQFYVSPFNEATDGYYTMRLPEPGERLDIAVTLHRPDQAPFVAAVRGRRRPATTANVLRTSLRHPAETLLVALRIRLQGVTLWLRKLPVVPRTASDSLITTACPAPRTREEGRRMTVTEPLPSPAGYVDPQRWPDIAGAPGDPIRARIAASLFRRVANRLPLHVLLPDGTVLGAGGLSGPVMMLRRPDAFYRRIGSSGLVGFGEAYMAGDWAAEDLAGVLTVFAKEVASLVPPALQNLRRAATLRHPHTDTQSKGNQKHNIARHYDLSNEMFTTFLDPTMTYSSALFTKDELGRVVADETLLETAQHRKIDRLLDAAGVTDGSEVLEIGTGWGELALRAAARGATVLSVTLSEEQRKLAIERVEDAGLSHLVEVEICDYRDVQGSFDAVVSVEMIEAVGYQYWPSYFNVLDARLKPGGKVGLQAITMPHDRMMASRDTFTWIHKYIFPGGLIPSVTSIEQSVFEHTSLRVADRFAFGQDYAETLRIWRERFEQEVETVEGFGFDATFRRMWSLYLAYSEAGFRSGYLDVYQFVLEKGASANAVGPSPRPQES